MSGPPGGRLRPWLALIRLPAVFTAPADVLAGLALGVAATGRWPEPVAAVALVGASAAAYCAGMAANDLFDRAIDARERPGRPIPAGQITVAGAWRLVLGLQAVALGLAALGGLLSLAIMGALIGAVYLYNGGAKAGRLGPWAMGLCRYLNGALGLSLAPEAGWPWWLLPVGTLIFVAGVTGLSRHEVEGARRADLRLPILGLGLGLAVPAAATILGPLGPAPLALSALGTLAWLAGPLRAAWRDPGARSVRGAVMAGIFGIAMVNAQLALATPAWPLGLVAVALLVPGRLCGRWFYAT